MTDEFKDRIDVHFHYLSPEYREKMIDAVGGWADGFPAPQLERGGDARDDGSDEHRDRDAVGVFSGSAFRQR